MVRDGIAAAPGIVSGPARVLRWRAPDVPHVTVAADEVDGEIERFHEARRWAQERIRRIQEQAGERLGPVEAHIFEPQIMMLDDVHLVEGTVDYIRDNHLSAARAFELRMLEFESEWRRSGNSMVLDRLNDLRDVQVVLLRRLLELPAPDLSFEGDERVVLVARDLTPTITVQLDREAILGIATDVGTRTSHSAILARALDLPAVVSLGEFSEHLDDGAELILDGRSGRVVSEPDEREKDIYRERDIKIRQWEQELVLLTHLDSVTPDGEPVTLRANIDMPDEAQLARTHAADGVGLFRTEFLVVGQRTEPDEEWQYGAYRQVAEAFPDDPVCIRTYDLGGDKFPLFLDMPAEENPYLGWRAIRVCLDRPELFRTQLRALLRASAHGELRIMLPLINEIAEVRQTRALLDEEEERLRADGVEVAPEYELGVMIETPAAALTARELAEHADFFSIGTNDLVQYTVAVDRGNARLASRYKPFHPAIVRLLRRTAEAARAADIELSVCGELAANPLGVCLLLGLGITRLSVGPGSLPEVKKIIRSVPAERARAAVAEASRAETAEGVAEALTAELDDWLDLSLFSGRWNLSRAP